jgi:acetyltransferase-like isoleucine patch superfamily enzyme
MKVGRYTFGTERITVMYPDANILIGSFCSIGQRIKVYLGGNHDTRWCSVYPFGHINTDAFPYHGRGHPITNGPIIIKNDVWICDGVTIMSGVTIGDGAVVANGSHVVTSIPPYAIYGGNPAQLIRYRFGPEAIERFLKIRWWNFPDITINKLIPLLRSPDVEAFLTEAEKYVNLV